MADSTPKLRHLGIIPDGNRRWARVHGLPTLEGHRRGFKVLEEIIPFFQDTEVEFLSIFAFSTENWDRSTDEVSYLMKLIQNSISSISKKCQENNLRLLICGRPERVEPKLWQKIQTSSEVTWENTGLTICICFNYGGHWEIADAASRAIAAGETSLTPETFAKYLYHPEVPELDLIVRTSGEERISGFQLWRAAYSEFLFIDKHFPDFTKEDCRFALESYHNRKRRFGK